MSWSALLVSMGLGQNSEENSQELLSLQFLQPRTLC